MSTSFTRPFRISLITKSSPDMIFRARLANPSNCIHWFELIRLAVSPSRLALTAHHKWNHLYLPQDDFLKYFSFLPEEWLPHLSKDRRLGPIFFPSDLQTHLLL